MQVTKITKGLVLNKLHSDLKVIETALKVAKTIEVSDYYTGQKDYINKLAAFIKPLTFNSLSNSTKPNNINSNKVIANDEQECTSEKRTCLCK